MWPVKTFEWWKSATDVQEQPMYRSNSINSSVILSSRNQFILTSQIRRAWNSLNACSHISLPFLLVCFCVSRCPVSRMLLYRGRRVYGDRACVFGHWKYSSFRDIPLQPSGFAKFGHRRDPIWKISRTRKKGHRPLKIASAGQMY